MTGEFLGYDCNSVLWPVPAEEYHAARLYISHGQVEAFIDSPKAYAAQYVHGGRGKATTDEMRLGSALHECLLQPAQFYDRWGCQTAMAPDGTPWNMRTKAHQQLRAKFERQYQGRILTVDEIDHVHAMRNALTSGKATGPYLKAAGAIFETPILWRDEETGLICKCMPDVYIPSTRTVINVKTSRVIKPRAFARQIEDMGYHRGAAWYLDGEAALYGPGEAYHAFAVVHKETLETAVYTINPAHVAKARDENRKALRAMAECFKTGDWSAEYEREPIELDLSDFAFNGEKYDIQPTKGAENGDSGKQ